MWIPQLISCGIHMKSEILCDHAAPRARVPRASARTAPIVTAHHLSHRCTPSGALTRAVWLGARDADHAQLPPGRWGGAS